MRSSGVSAEGTRLYGRFRAPAIGCAARACGLRGVEEDLVSMTVLFFVRAYNPAERGEEGAAGGLHAASFATNASSTCSISAPIGICLRAAIAFRSQRSPSRIIATSLTGATGLAARSLPPWLLSGALWL